MESRPISLAHRGSLALATFGGVIVSLFFAFFYAPVIPALVRDWYENSTYSYGLPVPFIAGYLVWQRRGDLKSIPLAPSLWAGIPLLIAVLLGLLGQAIGDTFSMRVSMILALGSAIYLLLGKYFLRALLFPLFYLSLMIPFPYVFIKEFAYHIRFVDAALAAGILEFVGVPVYREAYFLHLPNITLEVADVCAGLGSIFALFAVGTFYVYFLAVPRSFKLMLMLSTLPIAVIANLVRIIIVAAMAYYIGPITLKMFFHRFSGSVTFLMALALLILVGECMRRKSPRQSSRPAVVVSSHKENLSDLRKLSLKSSCLGMAILVSAIWVAALLNGGRTTSFAGPGLKAIPGSLYPFREIQLSWQGRYEDPQADASISRIFTAPDHIPIELFVGYKGLQNGADRLISPKLILPEHWNFAWVKPARLYVANGALIDANWMLTRNGNASRLVLYWYQLGGATLGGELDYRIALIKRLVRDRRSDGAVVRLATPLREGEMIETAQERLRAFSIQLYPSLVKVLPD